MLINYQNVAPKKKAGNYEVLISLSISVFCLTPECLQYQAEILFALSVFLNFQERGEMDIFLSLLLPALQFSYISKEIGEPKSIQRNNLICRVTELWQSMSSVLPTVPVVVFVIYREP